MLLIERGLIRLDDKVAEHLPEIANNGKDEITTFQLLTHQAGLIPDNRLADYEVPDEIWSKLSTLFLAHQPGEKFVYSDVGFQVLGELVYRKTGRTVDQFAKENIFGPLGMHETGYLPSEPLRNRAAVTEQREGRWMRGEVHDPRAYAMGGVAGHAGLFSTATDLARYAQMMHQDGQYGGVRVLSPRTVRKMTAGYTSGPYLRGLGWDKKSKYSTNRSELATDSAFGHGGFTGTAMWIDPELKLTVIFLSNRVHPDGTGSVNPLAGRIGTIATAAIIDEKPFATVGEYRAAAPEPVWTGIDVLERDGFRLLAGKRVGLITNHTGRNRGGVSTVQLLHEAKNLKLVHLFSPEHGIRGELDQPQIADGTDGPTGLPIYSLYGASRAPTAESLENLDALVFDIQDIGTRFYTYISTMGNAMRAASRHGVTFVVLDRPNPIGGVTVEGPMLDAGRESFVGYHPLPVRHGMTVGELARMFRGERSEITCDLEVVKLEGWDRRDLWDKTHLEWVNPSPNMRSSQQALLYPGIGLLETTNLSVGRGTDTPFEVLGAPWIDGQRLAWALNDRRLPGLRFVPIRFTPSSSKFSGEQCQGVRILITIRDAVRPVPTGLIVACHLRDLFGDRWEMQKMDRLLGNRNVLHALRDGKSAQELLTIDAARLEEFRRRRDKYLIY